MKEMLTLGGRPELNLSLLLLSCGARKQVQSSVPASPWISRRGRLWTILGILLISAIQLTNMQVLRMSFIKLLP